MKVLGRVVFTVVVAVLFVAMQMGTSSANLVTNGDFGTVDFTGWTVAQVSDPTYFGVFTTTSGGSGPAITPPPGFHV